jgi:hypothetical protein
VVPSQKKELTGCKHQSDRRREATHINIIQICGAKSADLTSVHENGSGVASPAQSTTIAASTAAFCSAL